jgi:uncharacterized protein YjbI with pentapeptide repeats
MSMPSALLSKWLRCVALTTIFLALGAGSINSQSRGTSLDDSSSTSAAGQQHYYALVIGNNDYQYEPKLKTAVNDAEAVAQTLSTQYGFDVQLLLNATRAQIMGALNKQRRTVDGNSSLLIYYAGHGARDDANGLSFWLPVDAGIDDTTNWIDSTSMTSLVKSMAALHVLVVSDSCFSGGMTRTAVTKEDLTTSIAKKLELPSRNLMASGSNEPVTDAGGTGHSIFAEAFLQGLGDRATDRITGKQLFVNFVEPVVNGRASQNPLYVPLRDAGVDRGDFVFVRHASAGASAKGATASASASPAPEPPAPSAPTHYQPAVIDSMSVSDALAMIDRAQHMMPKGDSGQVAAAESLIRAHHSLAGVDISGVSLRGARLPNGDLSNTTLVASDLSRIEAGSTDLSRSDLVFSNLENAHLEGAELSGSKLDFAVADGAHLHDAKASSLRGFALSAQNTDWGNADLSHARFMFADLRGAKFEGADLRGAFFVGSDLTGATFRDAKIDNTDFSGSKVDWKSMDERQRNGACVTPGPNIRNVSLLVIDEIPSSRYDGGMENSRWVDTLWGFDAKVDGMKACAPRNLQESFWYPVFAARGKELPTDQFRLALPDALVRKRGAEIRDRIEERHNWKLQNMDAECRARCAVNHCTCL